MTDYRKQGLQPTDTPDILYKYVPFAKYSLRLLRHSEIWLASPRSFNDPFDSKLHYNYKVNDPVLRQKWAEGVVGGITPGLASTKRQLLAKKWLDDIDSDPDGHRQWFNDYQEKISDNKFGICSLTTKPDNLLMWAHYASDHEGFCVGFDTKHLGRVQWELMKKARLLELKRVDYSPKYPDINFYDSMMSSHWQNDMVNLLMTKSNHWKYEDEFRLLDWDQNNVILKLPHQAIRKVVMGCRIKPHNRAVIQNFVVRKLKHTQLLSAEKSPGRFLLDLKNI
ncbi:MAG: DUF2971 domain-containing protein [Candidatus Marinimicrobia bacterium]|nr:DUF2971 domain-containing protein [Candidatus Neomarinimicrobiota bacterium]